MRLHFSLTPLEIGEAMRPVMPPAKSKMLAMAILLVPWLAIVAVAVWRNVHNPNAGAPTEPDPGSQNLWATLLPSVIPTTFLVTFFSILQSHKRRLVREPNAPVYLTAVQTVLLLWPLLLLGLLMFPGLAVTWTPSTIAQVWTGLSPWAVLYVVFSLNQRRRKRLGARAVSVNAGALRPQIVTIDDDGFGVDDGLCERLCNWRYIVRCRETLNLLLLITEDARVFVIPKRAIAGEADFVAIRSILQTQVAACDFLNYSIGFPILSLPAGRLSR